MKALAFPLLVAAVVVQAAPDESREPPMIFALEVDGKRVPLELDRPLDLATKAPTTRVTLRAEAHRVFDFAGIRFHYPREMAFEADLSNREVAIWTLDGNDAVLLVQRYPGLDDPEAVGRSVADRMTAQYGKSNVKESATTVTLGKRTLSGTTLRASIAGTTVQQALYAFRIPGGSGLLILQDSPEDDGSPSADFRRTLKMLEESFRLSGDGK